MVLNFICSTLELYDALLLVILLSCITLLIFPYGGEVVVSVVQRTHQENEYNLLKYHEYISVYATLFLVELIYLLISKNNLAVR